MVRCVELDRRRVLRAEVWLVLGVSLGASAVYAAGSLVAKLTAGKPLSPPTGTLTPARGPGGPSLALAYQLLGIFFAPVPAILALHLMAREPGGAVEPGGGVSVRATLGLDRRRPAFDLTAGTVLAAVIGLPGVG